MDGVLDTALLGADILPAIKDGGTVVAVRPWTDETERDISAITIMVGQYAKNANAMREIADAAARGVIRPRVTRVVDPADIADAHREFEAGGMRGRLVIDFSPAD